MQVDFERRTDTEQSWVPSLVFWLCLFVAAALYATAFLSPKMLAYARLSSRHHDNQARLVDLREHCDQLKIVQDALQSDPEMQAELARIEFGPSNPEEQRITVGNGLTLNAIAAPPLHAPPDSTLPWYTPLLEFLTENRQYSQFMLATAAVLVLYGFIGMRPTRWA